MRPFELVIDEHGPAVFRFCAGRVGRDRAEDCFQETMLAALRGYPEVREEKAVKAWLFTIASRKSIDFYRAGDRTPEPTDLVEPVVSRRSEDQPGSADIWSLVDDLPVKQCEAIHLRYRAGLSHREVGEVMATSEAAARRSVFEGLRRLREESGSWA